MARLHLRARFGLALAAVTFSIAGRTYKMADPCILLWFIYFFLLKKQNSFIIFSIFREDVLSCCSIA